MALDRQSIKEMRILMGESKKQLGYTSSIKDGMSELQHNANYMAFVTGTDIGKKLNESLLKLEKISDNTISDLKKIITRTDSFLDTQEKLNSGINYSADPRFTK